MHCPFCNHEETKVIDSRLAGEGQQIRRRRECLHCGRRFTSYEQIDDIPYMVVKQDGKREEFSRKKLLGGLLKACEKRPVPMRRLETLVDEAESLLHRQGDREITTKELGEFVMKKLRELDEVAYVRFASVYRKFEDIGAFLDEVDTLIRQKNG